MPHAPCDHCQRPHRALWTHLIPTTLRPDQEQPLGSILTSLQLCQQCGTKRREDLQAFFAGAAPTELVCLGVSR